MQQRSNRKLLSILSASCGLLSACGAGNPSPEDETRESTSQSDGSDSANPHESFETKGTGKGGPTNNQGNDGATNGDSTGSAGIELTCPNNAEVTRLSTIKVEASGQLQPNNLRWTLEKPDGSATILDSSKSLAPTLTPDLPGEYKITLDIVDSPRNESASCSFKAVGEPPKVPLSISNTAGKPIDNAPFTFGHPFKKGAYQGNQAFELQLEGQSEAIKLQIDSKAFHSDGSLRHAIFSGFTGPLAAEQRLNAKLAPIGTASKGESISLSKVLSKKEEMLVSFTSEGKTYTVSLHDRLRNSPEKTWLDGSTAKEWHVHGVPKDENGQEHPQLNCIFNFRVYGDAQFAMVDVVVENNWTYQARPRNVLYDVSIKVGEEEKFKQDSLYHLRRARWKKRFWLGKSPQVHIAHDTQYLMETKSVPNYEQNLVGKISNKLIQRYSELWKHTEVTKALNEKGNRVDVGTAGAFEFSYDKYGPMGTGLAQTQMGTAGGRPDIGPLPRWVASYVLNQDPVTKKVALGMADLAGTWPMHYRDKATGRIVSIDDYPYISTIWNQGTTHNPVTGKKEGPAPCEEANKAHCSGHHTPDSSHQPAFAYVPYLLTGDYFYLEELHFWTNYNFLHNNPSYRGKEKGLYTSQQDRGQAWSMRTLGHSVYITPDSHPLKQYFATKLSHNLAEYKKRYIDSPPNQYGALKPNYSFPTASPWMDDFFTWAMGALVDLGFDDAKEIHAWKSKFPVQRMGFGSNEAKIYCWILGSAYQLRISNAKGEAMYQTIDEVYRMNNRVPDNRGTINLDDKELPCASQAQANAKSLQFEEMIGYGKAPAGFPSNMRPALAVAVDSGIDGAREAWKLFIERKTKPSYNEYPVWAVVPRSYKP